MYTKKTFFPKKLIYQMNKVAVLSFAALFAACAFSACVQGCVQGNIADTASVHEQVLFPGAKTLASELSDSGTPLPTSGTFQVPEQNFTFDISDALSKLSQIGTVDVSVQRNELSDANLNYINEVIVAAQPTDNSSPAVVLSDYMVANNPGQSIDMPVSNTSEFIQLVERGEVQLNITLVVNAENIPVDPVEISYDLNLAVSINVKK